MKITKLETFLANAGIRNYLFLRLHTDSGLTGVGEASLEWQEQTVRTLIHELLEERYVIGANPYDIEDSVLRMVRDQYQGGATVMTAISGIEIAMWDLVAKDCGRPLYQLLGGRCHDRLPAYANGWYGGARTPQEFAERAQRVVRRGYTALKFDPFGVAWKRLSRSEMQNAVALVEAVRRAVGDDVELMIEGHGRLDVETAVEVSKALEPYAPAWFEEPVSSEEIDALCEIKSRSSLRIAAGERLYRLGEFDQLIRRRGADIIQMDIAHCGGILTSKKVAAIAAIHNAEVSPHCSIGPVAFAAALHFDLSTPNFSIQEAFGEFDAPWRDKLVGGWNPVQLAYCCLSDEPGLGLSLNDEEINRHPYVKNPFPSLWDEHWTADFTQTS
jgi:galactonate dehydratase